MNYYNEIDKFAAAWLRELIKADLIAPGEVDERSIEDVTPRDLQGYTQCHFFAGIGVWSYALRKAGWPDNRPVWTGSCPCQPFSNAGKGEGFTDKRHLWPSWFWLIQQSKPDTIFGEQVEAAIKQGWLDLVSTDLEGIGYTFGAVPFPACSIGAPHIRQRIYFVADSREQKSRGLSDFGRQEMVEVGGGSETNQLAHSVSDERRQECSFSAGCGERSRTEGLEQRPLHSGVIHADNAASQGFSERPSKEIFGGETRSQHQRPSNASDVGNTHVAGPQGQQFGGDGTDQRIVGPTGLVDGFWRNADWLYCRDEKYRPVESGTFPLAHESPNRMGRLRGYGNAIVAPQAQAFIEAYLESVHV